MARSLLIIAVLFLAIGLASASRRYGEGGGRDDDKDGRDGDKGRDYHGDRRGDHGCDYKIPCKHIVGDGEDLWSICDHYGLDRKAVAAANPDVHDPLALHSGDHVYLPCELPTKGRSIAKLLRKRPDLSILLAALEAAGLEDLLRDRRLKATLFAPTNCAFVALLKKLGWAAEKLLADKEALVDILTYHVVPDCAYKVEDLRDGQELTTALKGKELTVKLDYRHVFLKTCSKQKVKVIEADLKAGQSIVHIVDQVLLPWKINKHGKDEHCWKEGCERKRGEDERCWKEGCEAKDGKDEHCWKEGCERKHGEDEHCWKEGCEARDGKDEHCWKEGCERKHREDKPTH